MPPLRRCCSFLETRISRGLFCHQRLYHGPTRNLYKLDKASDSPFRTKLKSQASKDSQTELPAEAASLAKALLKPTLVSTVVGLGSFGVAAIWEYETNEKNERKLKQKHELEDDFSPNFDAVVEAETPPKPTQQQSPLRLFSPVIPDEYKAWWQDINQDPRAHTVGPLIVADFAVGSLLSLSEMVMFGWKGDAKTRGQAFFRYTGSGRALPVVVSPFGHGGLLHLGVTSVFVWKYGDHLVQKMGSRESFWAGFVTAGTIATVGGILLDRIRNMVLPPPRVVFPKLKAPLVAFGAPYTVLYAYYFSCPEFQDKVRHFHILGREFGVPVGDAVFGLVIVDLFGLALGHRVFGNGTHLSAAAIGYYATRMGGLQQIQQYQRFVVQQYAGK